MTKVQISPFGAVVDSGALFNFLSISIFTMTVLMAIVRDITQSSPEHHHHFILSPEPVGTLYRDPSLPSSC